MKVHFSRFFPLNIPGSHPFELLLFDPTRYEISEKIRALACPLFEISTVEVYVHDVARGVMHSKGHFTSMTTALDRIA